VSRAQQAQHVDDRDGHIWTRLATDSSCESPSPDTRIERSLSYFALTFRYVLAALEVETCMLVILSAPQQAILRRTGHWAHLLRQRGGAHGRRRNLRAPPRPSPRRTASRPATPTPPAGPATCAGPPPRTAPTWTPAAARSTGYRTVTGHVFGTGLAVEAAGRGRQISESAAGVCTML